MIWDTIENRDAGRGTIEEWGGAGYSLAALDASLGDDWRVVPLIKVGRDRAASAARFLSDLRCIVPGGRFVEVPQENPRVHLQYEAGVRRCEGLTGGVPPWTWEELGPMVLGLDAVYANFITGFETDIATVRALRQAFKGPLYGDLHSLALGRRADGTRYYRPVEEALGWLTSFDVAQVNEDEMAQLGPDPFALAARALSLGTKTVCVTLGPKGAIYITSQAGLVRTARIEPGGGPLEGDTTGCGDVFGATLAASLLKGMDIETGIAEANRMARRNVTYRGATGLSDHLRGRLAVSREP